MAKNGFLSLEIESYDILFGAAHFMQRPPLSNGRHNVFASLSPLDRYRPSTLERPQRCNLSLGIIIETWFRTKNKKTYHKENKPFITRSHC